MDSQEFAEMVAFEANEPNPWEKLYFYIAQLTCYVVNVNKGKGKDLTMKDVLVRFEEIAWEEPDDGWKDFRSQLRNAVGDKVEGRKRKWQQQ